ncbi:MAG: Gfo/Idh/MocA family oxidoreductase [Balneolaceae bacterium]
MKEIRWGIVGCGEVCEVKSGPAFQELGNSKLVAVMRRNADKAADFASRHNVPKWYSDADKLINDPDVNAIYIATPPGSHLEYTIKAAKAGKPVYVEKPMGRTHAECMEMIKVCKNAGVPLFVAYYRRRLPYFLKVKELLKKGVIGNVTMVSINLVKPPKDDDFDDLPNWRVNPAISGGGYFHDLASHQLDLMSFLFGDIVEAHGVKNNALGLYKAEDSVTASFKFDSGLVGSGAWTFTSLWEHHNDEVTIIGDKGRITFACFDSETPVTLDTEDDWKEFSVPYPAHVQQPLIKTIIGELNGIGKCPSTGESAAKTNWVIDKVLGIV